MVLLDQLWDDVFGGPNPERGLAGEGSSGKYFQRSISMPLGRNDSTPGTPTTPGTPRTPNKTKENVWKSVFHPGGNLTNNSKFIGGEMFDKPHPNTPSVYDWLYSDDTRSKHHR
ncbi:auxin-repressed 12.5 kDa protein-like isoform X2 [Papaver somniferum]|uniref:auxin-repressed 12.5 kDa protein-like isoform X2 n=1 Tax=Papaver somniferum TaxID=3469 RepID=UPI000E6FF1D1|nr:auxin-repressed 12.5 kDa protein-like isoform X2 [Papaver somniferum]